MAQKLAVLGCQELARRSGTDHRKWFNPVSRQATTVPDRGSKDLKIGTVRAAVRQLGLDWQAFLRA